MPRCVFGDGTYRCTKRGIGNPPLCREHYELVADASEPTEATETVDFWDELLDRVLDHPYVQSKVAEVLQILKDPARNSPHYQGPGQAYAAEAPPRPRARYQAATPPPPPNRSLSAGQAREILHFSPTEPLTCEKVRKRQRQLARLAHPDVGGSADAMRRINDASTCLISQLR